MSSKPFFPDLKIRGSGKGFKIIIKSDEDGHLIINNLNNLKVINAKKVRLLPWYDKDNPIVMFRYNKNKKYNINKLRDNLDNFSEHERFLIHNYGNIVEQYYNLRNWDTNMEYNILARYIQYHNYDIMAVHHFLTYHLGGIKRDIVNYIPYKVPVKIPTYVPIRIPVETQITPVADKKINNIISTVTRKLEIVVSRVIRFVKYDSYSLPKLLKIVAIVAGLFFILSYILFN